MSYPLVYCSGGAAGAVSEGGEDGGSSRKLGNVSVRRGVEGEAFWRFLFVCSLICTRYVSSSFRQSRESIKNVCEMRLNQTVITILSLPIEEEKKRKKKKLDSFIHPPKSTTSVGVLSTKT